jgi:hypothetical protein
MSICYISKYETLHTDQSNLVGQRTPVTGRSAQLNIAILKLNGDLSNDFAIANRCSGSLCQSYTESVYLRSAGVFFRQFVRKRNTVVVDFDSVDSKIAAQPTELQG